MKTVGPEADGVNCNEKREGAPETPQGVAPTFIPKRKRGYKRAVKRGDHWAIMKQNYDNMMRDIFIKMFKPSPFESLLKEKDFEKMREIVPFSTLFEEKK